MSGRLVIAATPIGNLEDASPRLRRALADADVIAAEDTRRLLNLLRGLDVTTHARTVSYYDNNEAERTPELLRQLAAGATVVLVSDAGMPMVSDPGYRLVSAAQTAGIALEVIPGPSAVLTALALSGLPVDRFSFEGFLPRKSGERRNCLESLREELRTMVFFEAPHRLVDSLREMAAALGGDRPVAVCREMTKTYEEVVRGPLANVLEHFEGNEPRGEITVVVAGRTAALAESLSDDEIARLVRAEQEHGSSPNAAVASVAKRIGLHRQQVYDLMLRAKQESRQTGRP